MISILKLNKRSEANFIISTTCQLNPSANAKKIGALKHFEISNAEHVNMVEEGYNVDTLAMSTMLTISTYLFTTNLYDDPADINDSNVDNILYSIVY